MTMKKIPPTKKGDYFISFVEEGIFNPTYQDWVGGRVEIYSPDEKYAIDEIRFFTKRDKSWNNFREKWDFRNVTKKELQNLIKIIAQKYHVKTD